MHIPSHEHRLDGRMKKLEMNEYLLKTSLLRSPSLDGVVSWENLFVCFVVAFENVAFLRQRHCMG